MEVTPELAELFGVYVGDGSMSMRKGRRDTSLSIAASKDEKEWIDYIADLFGRIFHRRPIVHWNSNVYKIRIGVNLINKFFKDAGFPVGEKSSIVRAPTAVMSTNSKIIYNTFLRGYFDADGSLKFQRARPHWKYVKVKTTFKKTHHYYPRISLSSASRDLIFIDIKRMIKETSLRPVIYTYEKAPEKREHKSYVADINGATQLELWMKEVGSSNPVHITKYHVWKKFGFCPPRTTLEQRKMMLSEELNPEIFYKKWANGDERARG